MNTIYIRLMILKKGKGIPSDIDLSKMVMCEREYHESFPIQQNNKIYYLLEKLGTMDGRLYFIYLAATESCSPKEALFRASINLSNRMGQYRMGRSSCDLKEMGFQIRPLTIGEIKYMVDVIKGRIKICRTN